MATSDDPLWTLRPPQTDSATYLTYIEENINKDRLPVLHDVLQDAELTDSIGWDLVSTLIPLIPESTDCLLDVARLGNPKEVVLKVTECLRNLDFDSDDKTEDGNSTPKQASSPNGKEAEHSQDSSLPVLQFQVLVQMLSALHPRVKAKSPSRFLSSSLQAILAAYAEAPAHHDVLTQEIVKFVKMMTGTKRPHFPPRRSSSVVLLTTLAAQSPPPSLGANGNPPSSEEDKIQTKLLQSFVTHLLDDYMQSLDARNGISGLAWCTRYWEKIQHPYQVPSKISVTDSFNHSDALEHRLTTVGQLVAVAQDLEIHSDDLLVTILDPTPELEGDRGHEESYPSSADSIPLSKSGSLYLFTARKAMEVLYGGPSITEDIPIFPGHAILARIFFEALGEEGLRLTPEPLLDAFLFHGLVALDRKNLGETQTDEQFAEYLQTTSLISASSVSPGVRFHAHYLTSRVLHAQPKDVTRFQYIHDTLEHCPFESLKGSAVGWVKQEILDANKTGSDLSTELHSLFATPIPLSTLASLIWPDVTVQYGFSKSTSESAVQDPDSSYAELIANYSFYAASLNLLLMLLKSIHLHEKLQVRKAIEDGDTASMFVRPLREAVAHFETMGKLEGESSELGAAEGGGAVTELNILQMLTDEVEVEWKKLGWSSEAAMGPSEPS